MAVPFLHNTIIAPMLPESVAEYNGVSIKSPSYFEFIIPWKKADRPHYESGLVSGINSHVEEGDTTVVIGGGWGVTVAKAALNSGDSGEVYVYEGSESQCAYIKKTMELNRLYDRVELKHRIVGNKSNKSNIRGEEGNVSYIAPNELPECNVLELDCEGSELEILDKITIRPRVILVESHGIYDCPSSEVETQLKSMEYSIESKQIAEESAKHNCMENDVYVIIATKK